MSRQSSGWKLATKQSHLSDCECDLVHCNDAISFGKKIVKRSEDDSSESSVISNLQVCVKIYLLLP